MMFDLGNRAGSGAPDPLADERAAEDFVRALPADQPVAAQRILCDALAGSGGRHGPDLVRLRALVALDRKSRLLRNQLTSAYFATAPVTLERERELRLAILEWSQSFAEGYGSFLRRASEQNAAPGWRRHVSAIVVALFGHREIELLLSAFRYDTWRGTRWAGVFAVYRFALETGRSRENVVTARPEGKPVRTITPEQALIRLLLLQRLESGQFTPQEAVVARQWIAGWASLVRLVSPVPDDAFPPSPEGFVVDLHGAEGLQRPSDGMNPGDGARLLLDPTPIVDVIEREIASLRIAIAERSVEVMLTARRVALLSKLRIIFAARAVRAKRRGERAEVALATMQAMAGGLSTIFRVLGDDARFRSVTAEEVARDGQTIEITEVPETSRDRLAAIDDPSGNTLSPFPSTADPGVPLSSWQVRDRSQSGCRLRGRILMPQRMDPGTLIACRENEAAPWMLAVVRRLKRLVGSNVELGVEYLGCRPQRILLYDNAMAGVGDRSLADAKPTRSIALLLPDSREHPAATAPTVILPVHEYRCGRELTVLGATGERSIRLGDSLELQRGFVWASYEPIDHGRPSG